MKDPNNPCIFCNVSKSDMAHENQLAYASYDTYPVSKHHCLIVPKRHIQDYFELTNEELIACNNLIKIVKNESDIFSIEKSVDCLGHETVYIFKWYILSSLKKL